MKKQTAVEWLVNEVNLLENNRWILSLIKQAKEMEKQQIIRAHVLGIGVEGSISPIQTATEYYNETFKL